jgi:Cu-Zn family superoxide dismutase
MVVGVLGVGVAAALAASGAAVAHLVTVGQRSTTHGTPVTVRQAGSGTAGGADGSGMASADADAGTGAGSGHHLRVHLRDTQGNRTAEVDITPLRQGGNLVTIEAWHLRPGFHAIQLHSVGQCDPTGGMPFASAGDVLRPAAMRDSATAGAFPVLVVGANGRARARFTDNNVTIRDLSGASGSAIVLHAVLPAGLSAAQAAARLADDARPRIACGVVFCSRLPAGHGPTPAPMPSTPTSPTAPAPVQPPAVSPSTLTGPHW